MYGRNIAWLCGVHVAYGGTWLQCREDLSEELQHVHLVGRHIVEGGHMGGYALQTRALQLQIRYIYNISTMYLQCIYNIYLALQCVLQEPGESETLDLQI